METAELVAIKLVGFILRWSQYMETKMKITAKYLALKALFALCLLGVMLSVGCCMFGGGDHGGGGGGRERGEEHHEGGHR